ncbi:MAG: hypothetical protein A2176_10185 [Spirochaetes bacterium RBG_13_51_14]|nr:MAG: hypothetical protein A2176_10185 [Spirochaetes bacterium RBG_13_51_14]
MLERNLVFSFLFIILIIFVISIIGCASGGPITSARILTEMKAVKLDISTHRSAINNLKDRRVGKTGFFYIIDTNGTVVFHPQPALIGSRFKDNWFMTKLIVEKSGCLIYQLGNRTHVVFFDTISDSEILCVSILADDMSQPPLECQPAETN